MTEENLSLEADDANEQQPGKNENAADIVTILTCKHMATQATKKFVAHEDGTIEKISFSAGKLFTYKKKTVNNIYDLSSILALLMEKPRKFIVRGAPIEGKKAPVMRRMHGEGAAFEPKAHYYVALDIDKVPCPALINPIKDPEAAARWARELLPEPFRNVTCFYKFSSSQSVPKKVGEASPSTISIHLWFWCDRKVSDAEWKRYFKANPCPVDPAFFSPVQIHYTAKPIFEGMDDPLPQRGGILNGDSDTVTPPPMPEPENRKSVQRPEKSPDVREDDCDKAIDLLLPYYEEGIRDRMCGAIAGALYRGGWEAERAADFVLSLAEADNDPEAMERYNSALRICDAIDNNRLAQGIPTLKDELCIDGLDEIFTLLGIGKPDIEGIISRLSNASTPAEIEGVIKLLLSLPVPEQEIFLDQIKRKTGQQKGALSKILSAVRKQADFFNSQDLALLMVECTLDEHYEGGRCLLKGQDGNFWQYNGRYWEIAPDDLIRKKMLPHANNFAGGSKQGVSGMLNAGLNVLSGRVFREGDPLRLNSDLPPVMNCRNGELWFDNEGNFSFRPHRPESYLRTCLSVDYDPAAKSPRFDQATLEIFGASSNPEEMFRHFMELVGYICQHWRKLAIIVLMYGGGSNGKTSLMSILEKLLGEHAIMSDRISEIENETFKIGALVGKLLLIDDDVDAGTCLPDGFLKKISEEKTMTGQHKYRDPFDFKCRAVPVMLANHYPSLKDLSAGIRRRIMVIPFTKTFRKDQIIPGLFDEIWKEESSGILNHALAGFQRLRKRGQFDEPVDCRRAREEWLVRSNVFVTFVEESCKKGPEYRQPIRAFYAQFKEYCREAGIVHIPTLQGIKQRLESMGYDIESLNGHQVVRGLYASDGPEIDEPM